MASLNGLPDGSHIALHSDRDGDLEIFVMNADGSDTIQLTTNSNNDGFPQWSPDGSDIAFQTDRDGRSQFLLLAPRERIREHWAKTESMVRALVGLLYSFEA